MSPRAKSKIRADIKSRIIWLLETLFSSSQSEMARAIEVSPSLISRVVSGGRMPGPQLIASVANHPAINRRWLLEGIGQPLNPSADGGSDPLLPVSDTLLPDLPHRCVSQLTGVRATTHDEASDSRYWYHVGTGHPDKLLYRAGDWLLIEAAVGEYQTEGVDPSRVVVMTNDGPRFRDEAIAKDQPISEPLRYSRRIRLSDDADETNTATSDGGSDNSQSSDGGSDNSQTSDGGSDDSQTSDGGSDDSQTSDGGSDNSQTSDGGSDDSQGGEDSTRTQTTDRDPSYKVVGLVVGQQREFKLSRVGTSK